MSKLYFPGCVVKSYMTVIERWRATDEIIRDLFQVGTLSVPTFFTTYQYIAIIFLGGI